jgi:uncharacterized protein
MDTKQSASVLAPTRATERIQAIDILRGFALLGILVVNMELFNHSFYDYIVGIQPTEPVDRWIRMGVAIFAEGKFYSLFSFLFGLGMAIFMVRANARGAPFRKLYTRRLLALLGFGLINAYLIWVGDILILYAVLGLLTLFLFSNRRPRTLLIWAGIFLMLPIVINGALWGLAALGAATAGDAAIAEVMEASVATYLAEAANANAIYATGGFAAITVQRAHDMLTVFGTWPFMAFNVWAMFLVGLAAGKSGFHEDLPARKPFLKRAFWWGLLVGLPLNIFYGWTALTVNRMEVTALSWLSTTAQTIGAPALALAYASGLTLLALQPIWARRMQPMAAAGQMAITNYLAQNFICVLLFYGYGFGWYGVGQAAGLLIAVALWLVQLAWSVWWLKRFRFGPVEWLWRTLTYWSPQPLRRAAPTAVQTPTVSA